MKENPGSLVLILIPAELMEVLDLWTWYKEIGDTANWDVVQTLGIIGKGVSWEDRGWALVSYTPLTCWTLLTSN